MERTKRRARARARGGGYDEQTNGNRLDAGRANADINRDMDWTRRFSTGDRKCELRIERTLENLGLTGWAGLQSQPQQQESSYNGCEFHGSEASTKIIRNCSGAGQAQRQS